MKYNSALFNKFLSTISNNSANNNTNNNNNNKNNNTTSTTTTTTTTDNSIKVSPPTTTSIIDMAAVTNITPISNSLVTTTRFTDEYDLKEELGK